MFFKSQKIIPNNKIVNFSTLQMQYTQTTIQFEKKWIIFFNEDCFDALKQWSANCLLPKNLSLIYCVAENVLLTQIYQNWRFGLD
jgi:hypothetical protein